MFCALLLSLALSAAAHASALDRDTVTRWIAAAENVRERVEAYEDEEDDDELFDGEGMPTFTDIENIYRTMYNRDAEVRSAARAQGFRSADQWADVSARITMGLLSLEISDNAPEMDAEMARAMREMEDNPNVPPQMREMMMQRMQEAMGGVQRMTEGVREEDLPILRDMRSELRAVVDIGDYGDD
ncbi:MAG: hypothetical protein EA417_01180 [Gammaproteobacteria bacterium]|nr:MAG: hypothetical protein EA417_01180 [Gammaproteobacteria bacterium]